MRPLTALLVAIAVTGCAGTPSTTTDDEGGVSRSVTLHGNRAEARLEKAQELSMDGKFAEATKEYLAIYENRDAPEKIRAAALNRLAGLFASPLNPKANRELARFYYNRLVLEFPDSEHVERAKRRISELK